jgi:protein gp37
MGTSKMEWTDATWNPVTGCTKISAGCKHCYAERVARRLQAMGSPGYERGFKVAHHPDRLEDPLRWRKPRNIFVCPMGDLFHVDVSAEFRHEVFATMDRCPHHRFLVLTKRPEAMAEAFGPHGHLDRYPAEHIWLGTTVEDADVGEKRIGGLLATRAQRRFLSCEPLLGDLGRLPLAAIDWLVVGGESGPGARPMDPDWARSIRDQCKAAGVPFFMKQMAKKAPIPDDLMIREVPE